MTEPRKPGRPGATTPRSQHITLNLTERERAEFVAAAGPTVPLGPYILGCALRWLRSPPGRYAAYHDSGQAEADEADEWQAALDDYEATSGPLVPPPPKQD